jgi:3'(2'), 5'-bisphosphate nucleotidase
MSIENLSSLLEPVKKISQVAGDKIMAIYGSKFEVDIKADKSPLTQADLAAHRCIVEGLSQLQSFPIISEESADIPFSERSSWETYWLVDPLDGTKEFIKRNGDFTVNIALIHQHSPILGVVYVPVSQQTYFAAEGVGAFKQTDSAAAQPIKVRSKKGDKLLVAGSRSHVTPELESYLSRLPEHELTSIGSSLKLCLVAEGTADLYPRIGLTSEWDTGAAQCVVEQAGGKVTDLKGERLSYNKKESFLNPYFLVFGDASIDWTAYTDQ